MRFRVADAYGRTLNNLRLAVTDECNYRCIFCHMEGERSEGPLRPGMGLPLLRPSDYWVIARAGSLLGVEKYKITGGEPLLRGDITGIIREIRDAAPHSEVSMTTNGYLLHRLAGRLAEAGLERVNISIHSLDPERYRFITGVPGLRQALRGLEAAVDAGLGVKINMVVLRGVNNGEILDMARFAYKHGATLQLIELHPVGLGARFFRRYHYPLHRVERELQRMGARVRFRRLHNRPIYILPGGEMIEIVKPVSNPLFCAGCTRIRVGPRGDILPCLNYRGPRPSLWPVLRDKRLSLEEKIARAAEVLVDVVGSRRPFYMCTLQSCPTSTDGLTPRLGRLAVPKRGELERVKRELRRLLVGAGALERRAPGPAP